MLVYYQDGVNFVLMQYFFNLCNLGVGRYFLRGACHDVGYCELEEIILRIFHSSTYIAIGNNACNTIVLYGYAQA